MEIKDNSAFGYFTQESNRVEEHAETTTSTSCSVSFLCSRYSVKIDFDTDFNFFAITPAFNINRYSKGFEIEWLFWGLYISVSNKRI